jgi:hypothetical protein
MSKTSSVDIVTTNQLFQESTNNVSKNTTRYAIPEVCAKIVYSSVSARSDTLNDASSICKSRITYRISFDFIVRE